ALGPPAARAPRGDLRHGRRDEPRAPAPARRGGRSPGVGLRRSGLGARRAADRPLGDVLPPRAARGGAPPGRLGLAISHRGALQRFHARPFDRKEPEMATTTRPARRRSAPALRERVDRLPWEELRSALDGRGFAVTPPLLDPGECADLAALFDDG